MKTKVGSNIQRPNLNYEQNKDQSFEYENPIHQTYCTAILLEHEQPPSSSTQVILDWMVMKLCCGFDGILLKIHISNQKHQKEYLQEQLFVQCISSIQQFQPLILQIQFHLFLVNKHLEPLLI